MMDNEGYSLFSDELITEYARVLYREGCGEGWLKKLSVIRAKIRKAVIKEASVGVVMTHTTLTGPDGNEQMRTDWHIEGNYPEDGVFDLIPKAQP